MKGRDLLATLEMHTIMQMNKEIALYVNNLEVTLIYTFKDQYFDDNFKIKVNVTLKVISF